MFSSVLCMHVHVPGSDSVDVSLINLVNVSEDERIRGSYTVVV